MMMRCSTLCMASKKGALTGEADALNISNAAFNSDTENPIVPLCVRFARLTEDELAPHDNDAIVHRNG